MKARPKIEDYTDGMQFMLDSENWMIDAEAGIKELKDAFLDLYPHSRFWKGGIKKYDEMFDKLNKH